jgi:hypothetical protein
MIAMLSDNPVGKALAWVSAGLLAVILLLGVAWMLPPSGTAAGEGQGGGDLSGDVPQIEPGEPIENYAVITDRPVFNESRQPVIGISDDQGEEDLSELDNVDAPDVELVGVVITPEVRVATLRVKDAPESLVAVEGQPLEGDFGSWRVTRIEPRKALLESGSGEQVRLSLQIHDAIIDEPPETVSNRQARAADPSDQTTEDTAPISRAEEIRQRIAERREELKRQAEEAEDEPPPVQPYRQAIQAMMQGRKDQETDENEQ